MRKCYQEPKIRRNGNNANLCYELHSYNHHFEGILGSFFSLFLRLSAFCPKQFCGVSVHIVSCTQIASTLLLKKLIYHKIPRKAYPPHMCVTCLTLCHPPDDPKSCLPFSLTIQNSSNEERSDRTTKKKS